MIKQQFKLLFTDLAVYAVFTQLFILVAVSDQDCSKTVGFLNYSKNDIVTEDRTFILDDNQHTIPCEGNVTAWEFCYKIGEKNESFNASIWKVTGNTFVQVNSTNITFTPTSNNSEVFSCQIFNLSDTDQFTAPAGSVVGLYSNTGRMRSQLLYTINITSNIKTYRFYGPPKGILKINDKETVISNYSISINVYLG